MIARDGRTVWFRDEFVVIGGEAGTTSVVQGVMLDITLRKSAEAQLEFLVGHGISRAQGFALGEPMRAEQLTPLLRRHLAPGGPPRRGARTDGARTDGARTDGARAHGARA